MDIVDVLKLKLQNAFAKLDKQVELNDLIIERSKDLTHGDYATMLQ